MADLTSVGVTSGVPSSGTGTVATINQLIAVGSPISNGSTTTPVIVNISGASSVVTSSMPALDVALSPNSAAITISSGTITTVGSISSGTLASLSSGTVFVSSGSLATVGTINTIGSISSGSVVITNANPNGTALSSNSAPVTMASNQVAIPSYLTAVSSAAGLTVSSVIMASGTNSTLVSSVARQLYKVECFNNSANIGYLHMYNLSSAPTAGSSLVFDRILVPANASGAGVVTTTDIGVPYTTGLSYTFTGGIADSDTTAVAASAYIVNLYYK